MLRASTEHAADKGAAARRHQDCETTKLTKTAKLTKTTKTAKLTKTAKSLKQIPSDVVKQAMIGGFFYVGKYYQT